VFSVISEILTENTYQNFTHPVNTDYLTPDNICVKIKTDIYITDGIKANE